MKHSPELEREQGQIIFVLLLLSSSACASLHPFYFSFALLYLYFHFLTFTPPPCTHRANMPSVKMKTYLLFVLASPAGMIQL